ncbi:MAG: murein biosynthesis integral membrane protein MurJ [Actinomycetota bacterium]|nr:murein biosynthesis integral membrane protein MurJ [Actinomycetota bacterium]
MTAILRAVLSMSAVNALSRTTGYARTMVMAAVLGTGVVANAYGVSNGIANLIYELFLGGILYSIFVPLLVERMTKHGEEDARRLTNALLTLILPLLAVVALLGIIFAEPIVNLSTEWTSSEELSPEAAQETTDLAIFFFRFFVIYIVFFGLGSVMTGVLNAHRRFFLPTFAPVLNNLIAIALFLGYALLAPQNPEAAVYLLAATIFGVAVMILILLPTAWRLGYRPRPVFGHPSLLPAVRLSGPLLVFVAASIGVQYVAQLLSTSFNAAPQLYYAFTVFSLPYGVFIIALETALMPELSERHARGDVEGYRDTLSFGLRTMAFIMVPASVGLIALATPTIGLLYERGNFTPQDTALVANLLVAYAVGLLAYATYFLLVRAFYSRQNTKTPALLNIVLFALYVALAYGLSRVMGIVGVALALSMTNAVLALVNLAATRREIRRIGGRRLLRSLFKVLAAGAVMYAVAWGGTALLGAGSGLLERAVILVMVGGTSLAAYLGVAFLLGAEELKSVVALLRRRVIEAEG